MKRKTLPSRRTLELLTSLAAHGYLFNGEEEGRLPASRASFCIRTAASLLPERGLEGIVEQLALIEHACWEPALMITDEEIAARIRRYAGGQYLALVDDEIVGVLYTQRIPGRSSLLPDDPSSVSPMNFARQDELHCPDGCVVQLLGIAVLPLHAHRQVGSALRDLVLQCADALALLEVVAMTRCSSFDAVGGEGDYLRYVASHRDPTLHFHKAGGATVVATVRGFRSEDTANLGYGVLVSYDLTTMVRAIAPDVRQLAGALPLDEVRLRELVVSASGRTCSVDGAEQKLSGAFLDTPFMAFGLDSLQLMELRTALDANLPSRSTTSATLLFDYPTPRMLLEHINASQSDATGQLCEPPYEDEVAESFAICGMACRFPGGCVNPDAFYSFLRDGHDAVSTVPPEWDPDMVQRAAFLDADSAETFDPNFFGLSTGESEQMDPHQRIVLEVAHEALVEAHLASTTNTDVGVFVGLCNNEWGRRTVEYAGAPRGSPGAFTGVGTAPASVANRISFLLGLTGPSLVVDTACSSSLTALHTACNAIRNGDCCAAVVAAADLLVSPFSLGIRNAAGMLSPDGVTRAFDTNANGYVRGEGAGAVVIRRMVDAQIQQQNGGPTILAVIRATAVNQNGRSVTLTAPNGTAQRELLRTALARACITSSQVSYLEAHGTGTALGDPIEWNALREVFLDDNQAPAPLVIGAVKSNIGHLEGAAGIAGLIKAVLCLRHQEVPANLHLTSLNPLIDVPTPRPCVFPAATISLPRDGTPLFAGISSFGSGGTNAHVILQRYDGNPSPIKHERSGNASEYGGRHADRYHPILMPWRGLKRTSPGSTYGTVECPQRPFTEEISTTKGPVEEVITAVIQSVLRETKPNGTAPSPLIDIRLDSPLDSLGIDSLVMLDIRNRLAGTFGIAVHLLPSTLLFSHPTVARIAELISSMEAVGSDDHAPNAVSEILEPRDDLPAGVERSYDATTMQQAMLFHEQLDPSARAFVESFTWEVTGVLDVEAFACAWSAIARSHPIMRSSFAPDAIPRAQQVVWTSSTLGFDAKPKLSEGAAWFRIAPAASAMDYAHELQRVVRDERAAGIDVTTPPLFRIVLLPLTVARQQLSRHVVILTIHHGLVDGWSMTLLLGQLASEYVRLVAPASGSVEEDSSTKNATYASYEAFAREEMQWLRAAPPDRRREQAAAYWASVLTAWYEPNRFIGLGPLHCDLADDDVVRKTLLLPCATRDAMEQSARAFGVTVASFTHTAWSITLSAFIEAGTHGGVDLVYGCTASGRSSPVPRIQEIVGPVINTFPMRVQMPKTSSGVSSDKAPDVRSLVRAVHAQLMGSLTHENFPLAEILKLLNFPVREPMFSVIFDYQQFAWDCTLIAPSLRLEQARLIDRIGCPLSMRVIDNAQGMQLQATSESSAVGKAYLSQMLDSFSSVLRAMAETPEVTVSELQRLARCSPQPSVDFPARSFPILPRLGADPPLSGITSETTYEGHVESGQWSRASQLLANSEGWFDLSDVCLALLGLAISRWCSSTNFLVGILARPHALHLLPVTLGEFGTSSLNSFARAIFESRIASRPARPDLPDEASLIVCTTDLFGSELDSLQSKFSELAKPAAITVCMSLGSRLDFRMTRHDPRIPNEVVEGLRNTFASLLESMCAADQEAWSEPVVSWLPSLESVAPVTPPSALDGLLLHEPFITRVRADGAAQALVSYPSGIDGPPKRLRYDALAACAKGLARRLASVLPERLSSGSVTEPLVVAVIMEKGWEQVVAVLATHLVQAAYLPIEARLWPEERVRQVLTHSGAMAVLTQSWVRMDRVWRWLDDLGVPILEVNAIEGNGASDPPEYVLGPSVVDWRAEPDALAYLIYTSGSTGVPKGVCAHHQGARNTIADLASRYALGPGDRILALSSLSFDLSVFDIFGLLAAGGTIVLPPAETVHPPEPAVWLDLLHSQQVSVWNSVPAFLELLVTYLEATREQLPMSLRLIFLSGDWIPLDLPRRLRALSPRSSLQIVSLGGATEASIWSNQYEISQDGAVPTGWASIPYGQPLRNQELLVLDSQLAPCPPWVTGILYIGGAGVAHGYYRDPVRTATHFVVHPLTGALLFRTGDLARVRRGFHPGGLVEILGREDAQVKVHGFRIELGEIERVLSANPRVASAALAVHDQTLCAYVVLRNDPDPIDEADLAAMLQDQCRQSLPSYMVPRHVTRLPRLPISANGKLQRDLLPRPTQRIQPLTSRLHPESEMESLLVDVWGSVLHRAPSELSMDDNFFSIGGDSLRSLQLVARSRLRGLQISVPLIFEHPTIRALAASATWCASARPAVRGTDTIAPGTKPIFPVKFQPETAGESYPLVGVNAAHFVGLFSSSFSRSGIAPQIYFEWIMDVDSEELTPDAPGAVDVECLEHALNSFIRRHATFQSVLRPDGRMQVADQATNYRITNVVRFEGCTSRMEQHATQTRDEMMGGSLDVYTWPLFDIRITELSPRSSVIHIAISLFLMDAMSDLIFRHEISALYRAGIKADVEDVLSPAPRLSFMDYCLAQEEGLTRSEEYGGARAFWMSRLSTLSPGPRLPLLSSANFSPAPLEGEQPTLPVDGRFRNELRWLTADEWARARANCTSRGVTIPSVLIAVYSLTIAQWNSSNRFLLSILHMLRHQVHEDVNKMVGNCSSTLLCDIDMGSPIDEPLTFLAAVLRVARELSQNLAHSTMSGIEVMQELNRQKGSAFQTVAPFIFTTPIGVEQENRHVRARDWIFHERFFSEKVPHAACVNAVKEDPDGTACASLDIIEGIFPEEVMVGLNKTYSTLLDVMCTADPGEWERPVSKWLSALAPPTLREETVTDAPAYSPQQVDAVLMAQPNNKTTDGAVSPRTSFEASVRALFASTLGLEASAVCCVKHSFFDLGGNSLLAVRLSIALSALSERRLSVPSLFAAPTVEGIVAALTSTAGKVGTVSTNRCGM